MTAGITLLAFLIRIPNLSYPPEPVFDEVHYTNFAIHTAAGKGMNDVHPPLARLIFANVLKFSSYRDFTRRIHKGENFDDFPYVRLRLLSVFAGSLLAGMIFLVAKKIYVHNILAGLSALFVVFDGALISYSRLILPDVYILFFGFLGVLLLLSSLDAHNTFAKIPLLASSGFAMGCAASMKWSGLGFLAAGISFLLFRRTYRYILPFVSIALLAYVFAFSLMYSPEFIPEYTIRMFHGHFMISGHPAQSAPYFWPFTVKTFALWDDGRDAIRLVPNVIGWTAVLVSILLSLALLAVKHEYHFLLLAYLINYLPFFFIHRPLFIYHYFPALVFGYLLVPKTAGLLSENFYPKNKKRPMYIFASLVLLFFLIFIPFIY